MAGAGVEKSQDSDVAASPDQRLRVLHLMVTMPVGGAEDLVAAIVRGLDPRRFAVAVATLGSLGPRGS